VNGVTVSAGGGGGGGGGWFGGGGGGGAAGGGGKDHDIAQHTGGGGGGGSGFVYVNLQAGGDVKNIVRGTVAQDGNHNGAADVTPLTDVSQCPEPISPPSFGSGSPGGGSGESATPVATNPNFTG
jgi:hypothetical protein